MITDDLYDDDLGFVDDNNDGYSQFDDDAYLSNGSGGDGGMIKDHEGAPMYFEDSIDTGSQPTPRAGGFSGPGWGYKGFSSRSSIDIGNSLYELQSSNDDGVDTRKFRHETYTMLTSGLAINKTMKRAFKTKATAPAAYDVGNNTMAAQSKVKGRNKKGQRDSKLQESSLASSGSGSVSLAPLSLGSGQFQTQSQVLPIPTETKFLSLFWESFLSFGIPQESGGKPFDGCKICISISRVVPCLENVSSSLIVAKVEELVKRHYPSVRSNPSLSWPEFRKLAVEIFSDSQFFHQKSAISPSKRAMQQNGSAAYGIDHSFLGRGGDNDLSRPNGRTLDVDRGFKSPFSSIGNRFTQPPYKQLLQKQRGTGGIEQQPSLSLHNDTTFNISQEVIIDGEHLPSQKVKDVAIDQMKKQWRDQRKLMKRVESALEREGLQQSNLDTSTLSAFIQEENKDTPVDTVNLYASAIIDSVKDPGFCQPLLKQKVFELGNSRHRYSEKWEAMRTKREERYRREQQKSGRNELLSTFNRNVFTEEKSALRKFMYDRSCAQQQVNEERYRQRRKEQAVVQEHILSKRHEDTLRLSEKAAALRDALQSSSRAAKSAIDDEKQYTRRMNVPTPFKLSEESSGIVQIPDEITKKLKRAKRLVDYNNARQEAKEFFETLMSSRFAALSRSKSDALLKAANVGAPVSLVALSGDELIEDRVNIGSRSVSASALLSDNAQDLGVNDSIEGEAAMTLYLSQASKYMHEDDNRSNNSINSWGTDARFRESVVDGRRSRSRSPGASRQGTRSPGTRSPQIHK